MRLRIDVRRRVLAGGAALVAAAFLTWTQTSRRGVEDLHHDLVDALRGTNRTFSGRLGAPLPYMPPSTLQRSAENALALPQSRLRLKAIAARVIDGPQSERQLREVGIAHLVLGESKAAIRTLERAVELSGDPAIRSDLAAAYIEACEDTSDPPYCIDALAETDRALSGNPRDSAARFNRALALRHLGFIDQAAEEWMRVARNEPDRAWAAEAERQRGSLPSHAPLWKDIAADLERAATGGDTATVTRLVRILPRDARSRGESVYLASWGDAFLAGNQAQATRNLSIARQIAMALEANAGELLLRDSVAVVETATRVRNRTQLTSLAMGHRAFREGRASHAQGRSSAAEDSFRRAESLLQRARSPMALEARYYTGSSLYVQSRMTEARAILEAFERDRLEQQGYRGLVAQICWEYGLLRLMHGEYTPAVQILRHSATLFAALDEQENRATIEDFLADAHEFLGEPDQAWLARQRAIETLSRYGASDRVLVSVATAASAFMRRKEWKRAQALLNVSLDMAVSNRDAVQATATLIQRATVLGAMKNDAAASLDLDMAAKWSVEIPDRRTVERVEADRFVAEGLLQQEPDASVALYTRALDYFENNGLDAFTTRALLFRARAHRDAREMDAAQEDLRRGLMALERQRKTIGDLSQRAMMFEAAEDLFEASISVALAVGHEREAFDLSERARGRALLDFLHRAELDTGVADAVPMDLPAIQRMLAPDAAILTFNLVDDSLVAFVVKTNGLQVVRTKIDRTELTAVADRCANDVRRSSGNSASQACRRATEIVLAPVANALRGTRSLGLVQTITLATLPFEALPIHGQGPSVGESYAVVEAPSASILIECSRRAREHGRRGESVLVAATSYDRRRFPDAEALPSITAEIQAIASLHSSSPVLVLSATQVTKERLLRTLPRASLIHFAGHALVDTNRPARSRLLIDSSSAEDDLTAADVAAMKLDHTQLVYLSACRSGMAPTRSDGVESLAIAFIVAGAPSVVASRWDLSDDAAASLAARFHEAFILTEDAALALHRTRSTNPTQLAAARTLRVLGGSASLVHI
jgi:CHAT domain-containing protein